MAPLSRSIFGDPKSGRRAHPRPTAHATSISFRPVLMLVDTNVLSELARPRPNAAVVDWFASQSRIHLSVVTLEELAFGVARAKGSVRARLGTWLEALIATQPAPLDVTP